MKIKTLSLIFALCSFSYFAHSVGCPPDFKDLGTHCEKPRPQGRGVGVSRDVCEELNGLGNCESCLGLYYKKCSVGYKPEGCNVCAAKCPAGMIDFGVICQK
jgi:hypothetical protein